MSYIPYEVNDQFANSVISDFNYEIDEEILREG